MSHVLSELGRTGEGDPRAPNRVLYETVDINNMQNAAGAVGRRHSFIMHYMKDIVLDF